MSYENALFQERVVRVERPSAHWTLLRAPNGEFLGASDDGLPYNGPDADVVEAPGGSYILYDSRIWHRAGVNRTERKRAAMLQAVIPMYIMPKTDTSRAYRNFIESPLVEELTPLELKELKALMITKIEGSGGKHVVTTDETLSEIVDN